MKDSNLTLPVGEVAVIAFIIGIAFCAVVLAVWSAFDGEFMRGIIAGGAGAAVAELVILKLFLGWGPRKTNE